MNLRINDIDIEIAVQSNVRDRMSTGSMDEVFLNQLKEVIEENLGNEQFTVEELADSVAYSRSQLHRKVHKLTKQSISQYIRNMRLERGMEHLEKNIGTVSEISFKVGFSSSTYFIKCFSERYGISPGEVRKKVEANESYDKTNNKNPGFDSLHPGSSESLIHELYEHLIFFKPDLEKHLAADSNEESSLDIRILAYEIIKSYPWPIAVELRRLFSGSMKEAHFKRVVQLKRAINRILDFFTYLLLCELLDSLHRNDLKSSLKNICKTCLQELTLANQSALFRETHPLIANNILILFTKELDVLFDDSFFRELRQWEEIEATTAEMEIDEICSILEQSLIFFVKKAAFLSRYQLINVNSIKVNKLKYRSPQFRHELHLLNNIDTDFAIQEESLEQFSDSNAILLVRKFDEPNGFINLSPFVIDTHTDPMKEGKKKVKRDVFLFKKMEGDKLHYVGSEVMAPTDLSEMDNYPMLVAEYHDALKLLNQ